MAIPVRRVFTRVTRRATIVGFVLALAAAGGALAQPSPILPADQVVSGMKGYGLTDFGDGKGVQRFDVEIIGTLKRFAPGQDMILGRVSGEGLERSGIIAGMSGSPIYVDGKLVGALAYGWPELPTLAD